MDPHFRANPYPTLERLREEDPVHRDPYGIWIVTRHSDVQTLGRDPRLGRDYTRWRDYSRIRPFVAESVLERTVEDWLLFRDPPDHTRLRRLISSAFTPRAVAAMRRVIEAATETLLAPMRDLDEVDLITQVAEPLPLGVIGSIIGLPADDFPLLKTWSDALTPVFELGCSHDAKRAAEAAVRELRLYFADRVKERRSKPANDMLGALIEARDLDDRLSEDEIVSTLVLLVVAGHETTTNLLGNGMLALLRHPAEMNRLRASPGLLPLAVEEFLRYDCPVAFSSRVALRGLTVSDRPVAEHDLLYLMLASANRDPEAFANPGCLVVDRDPNPHSSFGAGAHYCLGAALARLEGMLVFEGLLRTFRTIEVHDPDVKWRDSVNLRGLSHLPLHVGC